MNGRLFVKPSPPAATDPATIDRLSVWGLDHHRAPIALRERLAVPFSVLQRTLQDLRALPGIRELVLLSTCNRTEFYLVGGDRDALLHHLSEQAGVPTNELHAVGYWLEEADAMRHVLRVAASLESMVVGEDQIVHQIKQAFEQARHGRCTGPRLNRLFRHALATAGDIRSRTAIGQHRVSIASVAVDLAREHLGDLGSKRLLVIGAGDVSELVMTHLRAAGVRQATVLNRSHGPAKALASTFSGKDARCVVIGWGELETALGQHDIVITSTSAPHPIIDRAGIEHAAAGSGRSLMLIDLAVPRDVDPSVGEIPGVRLRNIDDLQAVVDRNWSLRHEEISDAEHLVALACDRLLREESLAVGGMLEQVAAYFESVQRDEGDRLTQRLPDVDETTLRYGIERATNKLRHRVMDFLRRHPGDADAQALVRDLLDLPPAD